VTTLRALLIVLLTGLLSLPAALAEAADGVAPVGGPVVRGFDPPAQRWLSGHRGIDLLAAAGAAVFAVLPGTVSFAGRVAGTAVVVISHGDTRTTYEPVIAMVAVGQEVSGGEQLGTLAAGHSCPGGTCLHLGWLRGQTYLDPSVLFDTGDLRLLPATALAIVRQRAATRAAQLSSGSPGLLMQPVPGRIGSGFGMRLHPIFHVWRMHSGIDIGSPCGTPIRAAAEGVVVAISYDSASGHRLTIDHGRLGEAELATIYLHARRYSVRIGQHVHRGQMVGEVGSTGWSTGCHLHLSVRLNGRLVDPQRFL
jgi:murein DD-endopeptidase MepM/ murein hydrolase activator NlpD